MIEWVTKALISILTYDRYPCDVSMLHPHREYRAAIEQIDQCLSDSPESPRKECRTVESALIGREIRNRAEIG